MQRPEIDQQVTFLYARDLAETAVFYRDLLCLPLVLDQGSCQIFGVTDTAFIGFCRHIDPPASSDYVILTLVSARVEEWHQYLQQHGVPIEKPPTFYEKFNITHLFIRDPNGYLVEIQTFHDPVWPAVGG